MLFSIFVLVMTSQIVQSNPVTNSSSIGQQPIESKSAYIIQWTMNNCINVSVDSAEPTDLTVRPFGWSSPIRFGELFRTVVLAYGYKWHKENIEAIQRGAVRNDRNPGAVINAGAESGAMPQPIGTNQRMRHRPIEWSPWHQEY